MDMQVNFNNISVCLLVRLSVCLSVCLTGPASQKRQQNHRRDHHKATRYWCQLVTYGEGHVGCDMFDSKVKRNVPSCHVTSRESRVTSHE